MKVNNIISSIKSFLPKKSEINNKEVSTEKYDAFVTSLMLLFEAAESLMFDCLISKEEQENRDQNIYNAIIKCRECLNNLEKQPKQTELFNQRWLQSLGLLYESCKPKLYRCLRTEQEKLQIDKNIKDHINYCEYVGNQIELKKLPVSWDDYNNKELMKSIQDNEFAKEDDEIKVKYNKPDVNIKELEDQLTDIFAGKKLY